MKLTFAQKIRWVLHLYKALFKCYHTALINQLKPFVKQDGVIIDIGGHSGQFSKQFARFVPKGKVIAFEPGAYARSLLKRVKKWHRLDHLTVIEKGVSDRSETKTLYVPVKESGAMGYGLSSVVPSHDSNRRFMEESIALIALDDYVADVNLPKIDVIKMDVEGWELSALKGALKTLERDMPALLIEIDTDHQARAGRDPQAIFDLLLPLGYVAFKSDYLKGYTTSAVEAFDGTADYIFVTKDCAHLIGVS